MPARLCILMAILSFTVVHIGALFQGNSISSVWLISLITMATFAVIGFFIGWLFESLIKESLIQEEGIMFSDYLKKNPDAKYHLDSNHMDMAPEDQAELSEAPESLSGPTEKIEDNVGLEEQKQTPAASG